MSDRIKKPKNYNRGRCLAAEQEWQQSGKCELPSLPCTRDFCCVIDIMVLAGLEQPCAACADKIQPLRDAYGWERHPATHGTFWNSGHITDEQRQLINHRIGQADVRKPRKAAPMPETLTKTRERGIVFSAEMVRAIQDGRKTQHRVQIQPQPALEPNGRWSFERGRTTCAHYTEGQLRYALEHSGIVGKPGDRLWVRENFYTAEVYSLGTLPSGDEIMQRGVPRGAPVHYCADGDPVNTPNRHYPKGLREGCGKFSAPDPYAIWIKRSCLHMPRWASRITLELTDVRVERVESISEADAIAEGFSSHYCSPEDTASCRPGPIRELAKLLEGGFLTARHFFGRKWNDIHGPGAWDLNPFVWRLSFKRISPTEKGV